jgi:DNA polymerase-1
MIEKSTKKPATKQTRLLIIDSHALLHRAYHALPPLTNSKGEPIGAIYGFASILVSNIAQLKPDYLVACFDLPKPTLRHQKFADYKAKRPKAPDDLIIQFKLVRRFLKNLDIPILEKEGYEADDAIGTVITQVTQKYPNMENIVLTGDLDTLQLINKNTKILTPKRGISDPILYDEKELDKKYPGLEPKHIIEFKGLKGDQSDNIPGVPGVGEKTALTLVKQFGNLEKLYEAVENDKGVERLKKEKILSVSVVNKLKENKDLAFFSRELATIYRDVPIEFNLKNALWEPNPVRVENALMDFGLRSLVRRYQAISQGIELPKFEKKPEEKKEGKKEHIRQNSLF